MCTDSLTKQVKPTYNGWKNYETWNVMLWLDNDENCYHYYRDEVKRFSQANVKVHSEQAKEITLGAFGRMKTPDGVDLESWKIHWPSIARAMRESADE